MPPCSSLWRASSRLTSARMAADIDGQRPGARVDSEERWTKRLWLILIEAPSCRFPESSSASSSLLLLSSGRDVSYGVSFICSLWEASISNRVDEGPISNAEQTVIHHGQPPPHSTTHWTAVLCEGSLQQILPAWSFHLIPHYVTDNILISLWTWSLCTI